MSMYGEGFEDAFTETDLRYYDDELTDHGSMYLAGAFFSPNCTVKTLFLDRNRLTDKGAMEFAKAILSPQSKLEKLTMRGHQITDIGAKAFADAVASPICKLKVLILNENQITQVGAQEFVTALLSPDCKLEKLTLFSNQIDDETLDLIDRILEFKTHPVLKIVQYICFSSESYDAFQGSLRRVLRILFGCWSNYFLESICLKHIFNFNLNKIT